MRHDFKDPNRRVHQLKKNPSAESDSNFRPLMGLLLILQLVEPCVGSSDAIDLRIGLDKLGSMIAPENSIGAEESYVPRRVIGGSIEKPIALNGHCPVALVLLQGIPVAHNPSLKLIEYKETVFSFSDDAAADLFAAAPSAFLQAMERLVAREPLLVTALNSPELASNFSIQIAVDAMSRASDCSFGTQTPTHFLERHIDAQYEWNAWALRRQ